MSPKGTNIKAQGHERSDATLGIRSTGHPTLKGSYNNDLRSSPSGTPT